MAVAITVVAWALSRLVGWLLHGTLRRRQTPSFARVMSRLAGWLVLAFGVLVAVAVTFPSVQPVDLFAGLGFFSVAVGFAFQDILENVLAGVLLLFRQPFRSGDQIEVEGQTGTVEAISIRETRLRTYDGQLVLVPNRDVYKSVVRVQTHYPQRRIEFRVGVTYEADPTTVIGVILAALARTAGIHDDPAPEALVAALGSSTVDLDVRFWTDPGQHDALVAKSEAIVAVKAALEGAGIDVPAGIVVLQAAPSFWAALHGDGAPTRDVTATEGATGIELDREAACRGTADRAPW